jgi:hypothetical protein
MVGFSVLPGNRTEVPTTSSPCGVGANPRDGTTAAGAPVDATTVLAVEVGGGANVVVVAIGSEDATVGTDLSAKKKSGLLAAEFVVKSEPAKP